MISVNDFPSVRITANTKTSKEKCFNTTCLEAGSFVCRSYYLWIRTTMKAWITKKAAKAVCRILGATCEWIKPFFR